jgi:hypothetical protein
MLTRKNTQQEIRSTSANFSEQVLVQLLSKVKEVRKVVANFFPDINSLREMTLTSNQLSRPARDFLRFSVAALRERKLQSRLNWRVELFLVSTEMKFTALLGELEIYCF